jgi:ATP-dependent DNA ligase
MSTKQRTLINEPILSGLQINGELVIYRDGHLDFTALQQRMHPSAARARGLSLELLATFVVFDLLARTNKDRRSRPYFKRRTGLEKLLLHPLPDRLVLMPMSTDPAVAQAWMVDHCTAGIEGVVAKRLDQSYRPAGAYGAKSVHVRLPKPSSGRPWTHQPTRPADRGWPG